jgi:NhaA family Na+:H+ antiporter
MTQTRFRIVNIILNNSLLLLAGTAAAVVWANVESHSYDAIAQPLHFWVNDIGMVFFFALAAKEVFEATLPGGALASLRRAMSPLAAAVGGMAAPALIYVALALTRGPPAAPPPPPPPTATDISVSAKEALVVLPAAHPALAVLLLRSIAVDGLGMGSAASDSGKGKFSPLALVALMTTAVVVAIWMRHRGMRSFWPYVLGPGALSWAALYLGGFHPALALVPIVPFMPHSPADLGLFDAREEYRPDTLNRFEHWWAVPVQFVLFLFGFANAGVPFAEIGPGTYYVLTGLLLGKPIGILLFSGAARLLGASLPVGLRLADLLVVGIVASIGFTVSLFFATAAFPAGSELAETKMGALLSFAAAPIAILVARLSAIPRGHAAPRVAVDER